MVDQEAIDHFIGFGYKINNLETIMMNNQSLAKLEN